MATTKKHLPPAALEEQIVEALRPALPAPPNYWQFVGLSCELGDDPTHPLVDILSVCLYQTEAGEWRANALPALPPAVAARLVDLRASLAQFGLRPWRSTELHLQGDGSYQFTYSYEEPLRLRGLTAEGDATSRFEPAALLARFLAAQNAPADYADDEADDEPDYAPANQRDYPAAAPPAPAAPTVWVCTWCHEQYASARQPTSFQPGKCPRNPGKAHAWHRH